LLIRILEDIHREAEGVLIQVVPLIVLLAQVAAVEVLTAEAEEALEVVALVEVGRISKSISLKI